MTTNCSTLESGTALPAISPRDKPLMICLLVVGLLLITVSGCDSNTPSELTATEQSSIPLLFNDERPFQERAGTNFPDVDTEKNTIVSGRCCTVEVIDLQTRGAVDAIWGSLGVLDDGSIWAGVSGSGDTAGQILEIPPDSLTARYIGSVGEQTTAAGEDLNQQKKVHSRIRRAADGRVYFSSMNESGESWRDDRLPAFGSYIWSATEPNNRWTEVIKAPEAIIALETTGRYVYGLAYWDHVLYQYDTHTRSVSTKRIGSDCGHVSRNLLVDARERVYIPKLQKVNSSAGCKPENMVGSLVEVASDLSLVKQHPLPNFYSGKSPAAHQGITAFTFRADQSIIFTSQRGDLYHLISYGEEDALILSLGNVDPERRLSLTNMVSIDGQSKVGALVSVKLEGRKKQLAWMVHDIQTAETEYTTIELPSPYQAHKALLLYGSGIRDKRGRVFVGGRIQDLDGQLSPIMLRLTFE